MMKFYCKIIVVLFLTVLLSTPAFATNGDNLIGVGPISRAMGGVGIAAPQDAISAVFANPAAMCFGPFCPSSQVDFAGTMLSRMSMPKYPVRPDQPRARVSAAPSKTTAMMRSMPFRPLVYPCR